MAIVTVVCSGAVCSGVHQVTGLPAENLDLPPSEHFFSQELPNFANFLAKLAVFTPFLVIFSQIEALLPHF